MKKILVAAAASLALVGAASAQQAKSPVYGELGYTMLKSETGAGDLKPTMLRGIIGYEVHPNFAVEGMLGFGLQDDDISIPDGMGNSLNIKAEIQHAAGAFVKAKFNPTNELELFARLGFVQSKVKATATYLGVSASASDSDSDMAYGVGLNYNISPTTYMGVDYMSYYDKDGGKINGFTVGVGFRF